MIHLDEIRIPDGDPKKKKSTNNKTTVYQFPTHDMPHYDFKDEKKYIENRKKLAKKRAGIVDYSGITTTGTRPFNEDYVNYIDNYLKNNNYNNVQRAAILGQIIEESGGDPFAVSSTGKYRGIAQWDETRYKDFDNTRDPYDELDSQLQYLNTSIRNSEGGIDWTHGGSGSNYKSYEDAYNDFWKSDDLDKVSRAISFGYVRPAGKEQSHINRLAVARQVLSRIVPQQ